MPKAKVIQIKHTMYAFWTLRVRDASRLYGEFQITVFW